MTLHKVIAIDFNRMKFKHSSPGFTKLVIDFLNDYLDAKEELDPANFQKVCITLSLDNTITPKQGVKFGHEYHAVQLITHDYTIDDYEMLHNSISHTYLKVLKKLHSQQNYRFLEVFQHL